MTTFLSPPPHPSPFHPLTHLDGRLVIDLQDLMGFCIGCAVHLGKFLSYTQRVMKKAGCKVIVVRERASCDILVGDKHEERRAWISLEPSQSSATCSSTHPSTALLVRHFPKVHTT